MARSTVISYRSDLLGLAKFCPDSVEQINTKQLRAYVRELSRRGLKSKTINRHFNGFTTFWKWLILEGVIDENPIPHITLPRVPLLAPHWLDNEELRAFYYTPSALRDPDLALRDTAAWQLLAWLGLRRGELLNLRGADVNLSVPSITIRASKNKRDRIMPLPLQLIASMRELMAGHQPFEFVFRGPAGGKWPVKTFDYAFKRHLKHAGLSGRDISPHWLRHTFATNQRLMGTDIVDVQMMLGHADLKSTMVYVHFDQTRMAAATSRNILNQLE